MRRSMPGKHTVVHIDDDHVMLDDGGVFHNVYMYATRPFIIACSGSLGT